jgi:hypothetical protein
MNKLTKDPEYYIIVGATGLCVLVSILDFSGLLSAIPWLAQRIPTFMLLMLSTVLGYLVVERKNKLDAIELLTKRKSQDILASIAEQKEEIINLIQSGDIRLFERPEDTYSYFIKRIHEAKRSIDVTHFSSNRPPRPDLTDIPSRHQYYEILSKAVKDRNVRLRRVLLVKDREHIEWIKEALTEFSGCPFYLGCYRSPSPDIPMISLMIIDGEEVCLTGGERGPTWDQKTIVVKNPFFTKAIQEHFDVLWRNSLKLNERGIRNHLIDELEKSI